MDPRTGLGWMLEGLGQYSFRAIGPQRYRAPLRASLQADKFFSLFPGMTISARIDHTGQAEVFVNDKFKIYQGSWPAILRSATNSVCNGKFTCDGSLLLQSAIDKSIQVRSPMNLSVPAAGYLYL